MIQPDTDTSDAALTAVEEAICAIPDWKRKIREGISRAVDEVVDPVRSRRWSIDQLEKAEKTSIGIRVENILRMDLQLPRGRVLDLLVADEEVDVKFTIARDWMIPREAVGRVCLLTSYDAPSGSVSAGLLRTDLLALGAGQNQDRKRSVSRAGRDRIRWLMASVQPELSIIGFMGALNPVLREEITDTSVGAQERLNRLFLALREHRIPEPFVEAVAQHSDWPRRLRPDAANPNGPEQRGYKVLRQSSAQHRRLVAELGLPPLPRGYCMSIDIAQLA